MSLGQGYASIPSELGPADRGIRQAKWSRRERDEGIATDAGRRPLGQSIFVHAERSTRAAFVRATADNRVEGSSDK